MYSYYRNTSRDLTYPNYSASALAVTLIPQQTQEKCLHPSDSRNSRGFRHKGCIGYSGTALVEGNAHGKHDHLAVGQPMGKSSLQELLLISHLSTRVYGRVAPFYNLWCRGGPLNTRVSVCTSLDPIDTCWRDETPSWPWVQQS